MGWQRASGQESLAPHQPSYRRRQRCRLDRPATQVSVDSARATDELGRMVDVVHMLHADMPETTSVHQARITWAADAAAVRKYSHYVTYGHKPRHRLSAGRHPPLTAMWSTLLSRRDAARPALSVTSTVLWSQPHRHAAAATSSSWSARAGPKAGAVRFIQRHSRNPCVSPTACWRPSRQRSGTSRCTVVCSGGRPRR